MSVIGTGMNPLRVLQPPASLDGIGVRTPTVLFLAGSIEMDKAERWQDRVIASLTDAKTELIVLNPRRTKWDGDMSQRIENPAFVEQVEWELSGMDAADIILFYFAPGTMSPISLLELGLHATTADYQRIIVVCPTGYWRKGNVDIVCNRFGITQFETLVEAVLSIVEHG